MEPQIVRADPVLDNRPEPSGAGGAQRLVYVLLWAIGLILIASGAYARWTEHHSWLPEVCIALGVAVATPGALSYLYRKYMLDDIKLELQKPAIEFKRAAVDMIDEALAEVTDTYRAELRLLQATREAGIQGVFVSRSEALTAFMPSIENERYEVMIVGSSLRGLLQDLDNEYQQARRVLKHKVAEGIRLRFLLTHPVVADLRARQEDRNFKDIGCEIVESINVLRSGWGVERQNVRLYVGTPTVFAIKTSDMMLLNTYPYMKEAVASPCLIVSKPGYIYDRYLDSHFQAWKSAMTVEVPDDASELLRELDQYAEQVQKLLGSTAGAG